MDDLFFDLQAFLRRDALFTPEQNPLGSGNPGELGQGGTPDVSNRARLVN